MFKKLSVLFLSGALLLCLAPIVQADFSAASKNISNSALDSVSPKVLWRGGGIAECYVIWVETNGTTDLLYFSKSTDNGATWSTPYDLTTNGQILPHSGSAFADDYAYDFVVDDPYIHIVLQWRADDTYDWDIWYARSTDLGETPANWEFFALTTNSTDSYLPDIACRGEYVHVTYIDDWPGNSTIFYKRLPGYGENGTQDQNRRLTYSTTGAYYPRIAVSESGISVNVIYEDEYSGVYNLFYKHIYGSGSGSIDTRQQTFNTVDFNGLPDIETGYGTYAEYVYIVYQSFYPGNREIIYKRLDNWGEYSLSPITVYTARLTYSATESRSAFINFDDLYGNVHITYHDDWPGNYDVMYKKLTLGGGAGFSSQRVSWGTGVSAHASPAAHGAWAYVVWSDNSSGNYEILFKNGN
jgi:hypothetical protein